MISLTNCHRSTPPTSRRTRHLVVQRYASPKLAYFRCTTDTSADDLLDICRDAFSGAIYRKSLRSCRMINKKTTDAGFPVVRDALSRA